MKKHKYKIKDNKGVMVTNTGETKLETNLLNLPKLTKMDSKFNQVQELEVHPSTYLTKTGSVPS